jgi:hypothetical protein
MSFARLIPGHGPVDVTHGAIAQTRDWLNWLDGALSDAVARGLDMGEAGDMPIPDRFASVALARYELQRSVSHFYAGLEAKELPASTIDGFEAVFPRHQPCYQRATVGVWDF